MQMKNTSKFISLILRHKPETIGITLDEHGWADVQELINGINRSDGHDINMDLLERNSARIPPLQRSKRRVSAFLY